MIAFVGGCAADPAPSPVPPASTAPATPSTEPTPDPAVEAASVPERPAEMERVDEIGAAAAADYFLSLYQYALTSGDLTEWDAVSAQDCSFCINVRSDVTAVYAAGGHYAGGELSSSTARVVGYEETLGVYAVEFEFSVAASTQVGSDGSVVREIPAESGFLILDVLPAAEGWVLLTGDARDESVM
nr:DUF6318 family protein [Cellulomonas sp. KRMCY2]